MNDNQTEPRLRQGDTVGGPIESACDRFETTLRSGYRPQIETYLVDWEEPERSKLLSELLLLELRYAGRVGQPIAMKTFEDRFPNDGQLIADVFERWSASLGEETQVVSANTVVMKSQFAGLRLHAEGGLGIVFRAGDRELSRDVAVKFIRSNLADDVECRERFRMEAEITSRLEHPGVVPVYGLGGDDAGSLFYAMRFIEGQTLDQAIDRYHKSELGAPRRESSFEFRELLGRFVTVCKTIAYAHNRGIVHRDIKPDNVMLGRYGETIVIDWGLAIPVDRQGVFKQSGEQTLMPKSGSQPSSAGVAGTPAFMSPEQADGNVELTPASDIYSLGATLYKILVGQVAFSGSLDRLLTDVRQGNFTRPTQVDKRASRTVEAICLKAMSLDPKQRYGTAMDLARDIENYLADASVEAYREPMSTRLTRWGRQHRLMSQGILVGLLLLTLGGVSAAFIFGHLTTQATALQQNEHVLRKQSVKVSARFAADTIGNKVDIRLRILEQQAAAPRLVELIEELNQDHKNEEARQSLQTWLDERASQHSHIESRSWFLCTDQGWQVARFPSHKPTGEFFGSLDSNYAWRNYFNGRTRDLEPGDQAAALTESQLSVAMVSTNDNDLIVVLSAPIKKDEAGPTLGVIGMSIELGRIADLRDSFPSGQRVQVLLVDTRPYYMPLEGSGEQRGEGLVLHHEDLGDLKSRKSWPHLDDDTIEQLRLAREAWDPAANGGTLDNLLSADYRDPVTESDGPWLAAFAPVLLHARPTTAKAYDTGCFIIVQQLQQNGDEP